ncbi:MAG: hypothetical protein EOR25_29685 [Mesorhizobium sp.]|uniref:hypothetical protein n=1 Tax=Mesorhizobium sp. TaxID=1871066 RepID=UPI000FE3987B|nr:hypothetical protein [Mesorhizobium sp.]RWJ04848.1 MAG: hypothetical protein EOR24_29670 [Mesorhizobium sp.]RWJ12000.1 MAG: hypothetical protein EOR25_29685 [Mesorhizobium sp.]
MDVNGVGPSSPNAADRGNYSSGASSRGGRVSGGGSASNAGSGRSADFDAAVAEAKAAAADKGNYTTSGSGWKGGNSSASRGKGSNQASNEAERSGANSLSGRDNSRVVSPRAHDAGYTYSGGYAWSDGAGNWSSPQSFSRDASISYHSETYSTGITTHPNPIIKNLARILRSPKVNKFSNEDIRSLRSLSKQLENHKQKLSEFRQNPTVRPGMENLPQDVIERAQAARIEHLEREIQAFEKNINDIVGKYK